MRGGGVKGTTTLGELAVGHGLSRGPLMVQPKQGGEAGAGLGTQIEVHKREVPHQAATQLLVQLVDRGRHRKVTSERLLEVRPLTGHVVNQQYANHVLPPTPIALIYVSRHRAKNEARLAYMSRDTWPCAEKRVLACGE